MCIQIQSDYFLCTCIIFICMLKLDTVGLELLWILMYVDAQFRRVCMKGSASTPPRGKER